MSEDKDAKVDDFKGVEKIRGGVSGPKAGAIQGFCSACGIFRADYNGHPVTDCICTAKKRGHSPDCHYMVAVRCPIDVGIYCTHDLDACEECDCDCEVKPKWDAIREAARAAEEKKTP